MVAGVVGHQTEAAVRGGEVRAAAVRFGREGVGLRLERFLRAPPVAEAGLRGADLAERRRPIDDAGPARQPLGGGLLARDEAEGPIEAPQRLLPTAQRHEAVAEDVERVPVGGRRDEHRGGVEGAEERLEHRDGPVGPAEPELRLASEHPEREDVRIFLSLGGGERRPGPLHDLERGGEILAT